MHTHKEAQGYLAIKRNTSGNYAAAMKNLMLDESTPHGNKLAEIFDKTELYPKLMLYFNKVDKLGHDKAVQTVLMAFPTYNNLPYGLNFVNVFSPYMKFFASTPKMIMYGINQHPVRSLFGIFVAQGIVPASWAMEDEQTQKKYKWWIEHEFIKVPGFDWVYPSNSIFPIYSNPLETPFGPVFDPTFAFSAAKNVADPMSHISIGNVLPDK
jgi:hypothetical protein